jgi:hypothetical protein
MARLAFWGALAVALAVVVGCGPAKELPDEGQKGTDTGDKPVAVPAASDPAAKAYVEKAVKAYTGGKPELVAKGKFGRVVLTGTMRDPQNVAVPIDATRTMIAAWPDRFTVINEVVYQGKRLNIGTWLTRPNIVVQNNGEDYALPNRPEAEQNIAADATAQFWMMLYLPLTDPKAVVFDLKRQTLDQQPVQTLKLALGTFPVFQLTFDANTDALLRVEYTLSEMGTRRRKLWSMFEHKPEAAGLSLPGKMECRHDNVLVEEWKVEKWEFPAAINDAEFAPPKK